MVSDGEFQRLVFFQNFSDYGFDVAMVCANDRTESNGLLFANRLQGFVQFGADSAAKVSFPPAGGHPHLNTNSQQSRIRHSGAVFLALPHQTIAARTAVKLRRRGTATAQTAPAGEWRGKPREIGSAPSVECMIICLSSSHATHCSIHRQLPSANRHAPRRRPRAGPIRRHRQSQSLLRSPRTRPWHDPVSSEAG